MATQYDIQFKQATLAQWEISKYVPLAGEPLYAWDVKKYKIGDGVNVWSALPGPYMTLEDVIDYINANGVPTIDGRIGDLADLTTETQDSVVGAINEVNFGDVDLLSLYNNAKAG